MPNRYVWDDEKGIDRNEAKAELFKGNYSPSECQWDEQAGI